MKNKIEDVRIKQVEVLKTLKPENQELESIEELFPKNMRASKVKNEKDVIK